MYIFNTFYESVYTLNWDIWITGAVNLRLLLQQQRRCEGVSVGHVKRIRRVIKVGGTVGGHRVRVDGRRGSGVFLLYRNRKRVRIISIQCMQYIYLYYIIIVHTRCTAHGLRYLKFTWDGPSQVGRFVYTRVFLDITIFGQTLLNQLLLILLLLLWSFFSAILFVAFTIIVITYYYTPFIAIYIDSILFLKN